MTYPTRQAHKRETPAESQGAGSVMDGQDSTKQTDAALLGFLQAQDEAQADDRLADLIAEQAQPSIKGIVRSKLRVSLNPADTTQPNQDALDIVADIQTGLIARLRELRSTNCATITNFQGYVASVAFNACHRYLRRKYPRRWQLRNKLRYLLTHDQRFRLWEARDREWLCTLGLGLDSQRAPTTWAQAHQVFENHPNIYETWHTTTGAGERQVLINLLTRLFEQLPAPLVFDDLVGLVAEFCRIKDDAALIRPVEQRVDGPDKQLASGQPTAAAEFEQRARLQKLWAEISQLPLRHRAALLLNLKDQKGASVIALFPITRIATIRQIAEVLAFPPEDFLRVWNELPWDDLTIAKYLQITRQQVINLRQSARARLVRRLKDF